MKIYTTITVESYIISLINPHPVWTRKKEIWSFLNGKPHTCDDLVQSLSFQWRRTFYQVTKDEDLVKHSIFITLANRIVKVSPYILRVEILRNYAVLYIYHPFSRRSLFSILVAPPCPQSPAAQSRMTSDHNLWQHFISE